MTSLLGTLAPGLRAKVSLVLDLLALALSLVVPAATMEAGSWSAGLWWMVAAGVAIWVVMSAGLRQYDPWAPDREPIEDAALVSVVVIAVSFSLGVAGVLAPNAHLPDVGQFLVPFWPTVLVVRWAVFRRRSHGDLPLDDVLVVGTGPVGRATGHQLEASNRHRVLGHLRFPDEVCPKSLRGRCLGSSADLERVLRDVPVSEVYLGADPLQEPTPIQTAISVCESLGVPFALRACGFHLQRARPQVRQEDSEGYIHYLPSSCKPRQLALKRLADIVLSAAALWALSPLFLVVAAAIKLTSRGPVLFKQRRVGLHGQPFHMLKFRSMVADAEARLAALQARNEREGPVFKIAHDPRVTALGRVLRKYSIDELPQLINVLRGDMSLVGPRPPLPSEVAAYKAWQCRRLSVRPGLTCSWQVSGRDRVGFEEWMKLDMQYIDAWSLGGDLALILRTIPVVFSGRGAS